MKVLVIGGGGREHALIWKLAQSPEVTKLYAAPGNPGIASLAECVNIAVTDHKALATFARDFDIDLSIVGPEAPLVEGIVDRFQRKGMRIFGPSGRAALLEGSKSYAKEICVKHGIPAGYSRSFRDYDLAMQHLEAARTPLVVKADGLASGKGVSICRNIDAARTVTRRMMREAEFGSAGAMVVFEEFLEGEEISMLAISDGHTIVPFEPCQDHKALGDGDTGPNTGGMGTYSPLPQLPAQTIADIERDVIVQTIHAMNREGHEFRGCLFAGLMLTADGPKVLEFNVRFGDPETQTVLRRLKSDLFPLLWHACEGTLEQCEVEWDERSAVTVVLAAGGYPGKLDAPSRIHGLEREFDKDVVVFHSGTKLVDGALYTGGGRVLAISALGTDLRDARTRAYAAADAIQFSGKQMRRDIGSRGSTTAKSTA